MSKELLLLFKDVTFCYKATTLVLSFGLFISALEDIKTWPIFSHTGLLSWKISKLAAKKRPIVFFSKFLNLILEERFFKISLYLRLYGSLLLFIFAVFSIFHPFLFVLLCFLMLLITLRNSYGLDGGYQMYLMILIGLSLGTASKIGSPVSLICLIFIAGQLVISYFIAGLNKLISPFWRKPHALILIFSTKTYGHKFFYQLFTKHFFLALAVTWSVVLTETFFFTIFFLSPDYALLICAIGFSFHVFNAIFMGLNDFLFAFAAAYPALLFCLGQML
jgi:hypothetical protein